MRLIHDKAMLKRDQEVRDIVLRVHQMEEDDVRVVVTLLTEGQEVVASEAIPMGRDNDRAPAEAIRSGLRAFDRAVHRYLQAGWSYAK